MIGLSVVGCAAPAESVGAIGPYAFQATVTRLASTTAPNADAMPDTHVAAQMPAGFLSFCTRFADQCNRPDNAPSFLMLDPASWATLIKVNQTYNRAIRPKDDKDHYGRAEFWNIPTDGYGDCEDYALSKRKALLDAGFPAPALRIALVLTRTRERHAVLTVTTDHGDFVLDNLNRDIIGWDQTGYEWIERQDPAKAWGWVALGKSVDPTYIASVVQGPVGAAR
jgi:predicted transglutaminase-like cysteine proteinase